MMHTKLSVYHIEMSKPAQNWASALLTEQLSIKEYIWHLFKHVWSKQMEFASK